MTLFSHEEVARLVTHFNWELVHVGEKLFQLRQKDNHAMTTLLFCPEERSIREFCSTIQKEQSHLEDAS